MNTSSKILYSGLQALNRELVKDYWHDAKYTILLDENTFQHCLPLTIGSVETLQEAEFIEVPVGEECKCLEVAAQVWQTLIESEADRNTVIVNLGGGSVCDLGGFVASGYKRGIRHINVPTSLLSMVDAAIGGKTSINFGGVKNSVGHFHPSALTVIDPVFLGTLPLVEHINGRIEMVKTAAVTDPVLFNELISNTNSQSQIFNSQLKKIARIKARVVKADPYDRSIRKILNFGHTFGHAIEVYRNIPHGIAVGFGMQAAMYLSTKKTGLSETVYLSYSQWLKNLLSTSACQFQAFNLKDIESILYLMRQDKKNASSSIRCVLMQDLGAAVIDVDVTDNEIRDTLLKIGKN